MGKKIDLKNHTFNKLTVLEETSKRDRAGGVIWLCKCECGSLTEASSSDLRSGHKKSCGCLQKEAAANTGKNNLIDLSGKKYGLLTVIGKQYSKKTNNGSTIIYWKCRCDCGNEVIVAGNSLKQNDTKSCGCIKSFGEQKIATLLKEANLSFEKEKKFQNSLYRFDFFVENKYIIEYDGKQHYQDCSWGSEFHSLKESQKRDAEKNNLCHQMNIPIIRIPYYHYNNLELKDLLLETSAFIVRPVDQAVPVDQSRCGKCIYEAPSCGENDFYDNCPKYKRDPPDGGFYG